MSLGTVTMRIVDRALIRWKFLFLFCAAPLLMLRKFLLFLITQTMCVRVIYFDFSLYFTEIRMVHWLQTLLFSQLKNFHCLKGIRKIHGHQHTEFAFLAHKSCFAFLSTLSIYLFFSTPDTAQFTQRFHCFFLFSASYVNGLARQMPVRRFAG